MMLGICGWVVDLCKPTQQKYEMAVSVILGRNIDAVVVIEEATAIECMEVSSYIIFRVCAIYLSVTIVYAQSTGR